MKVKERKQAWIYCAIDAPEDVHDKLKNQYRQLCDYALQMSFEVVGSSSDIGGRPLWKRKGFQHFIQAVKEGRADILLIVSQNSLSRSSIQMAQLQAMAESYKLEIFSPLEGKIHFY